MKSVRSRAERCQPRANQCETLASTVVRGGTNDFSELTLRRSAAKAQLSIRFIALRNWAFMTLAPRDSSFEITRLDCFSIGYKLGFELASRMPLRQTSICREPLKSIGSTSY